MGFVRTNDELNRRLDVGFFFIIILNYYCNASGNVFFDGEINSYDPIEKMEKFFFYPYSFVSIMNMFC
jgi:hypothetical protein